MSTIFSVGSRLLGVYFAYLGLIYLLGAFALYDGSLAPVLVQFLSAVFAFAFSLVLMFQSEELGRRLGVTSEPATSLGGLEPRAGLHTGIVLIGLYVFLSRLGPALATVSAHLGGARFGGMGGAPARIAIEAIPLVLAVFFIVRADRVVELVSGDRATVA